MQLRFITTIIALSVLMLGAAATASAQYPDSAQIPFDFKVGDETLPAGRYELKQPGHDPHVLLIQNVVDARQLVIFVTRITDLCDTIDHSQLIFHRYGGTVFLAGIISRSDGMVRELEPSEQESRIVRELARSNESCQFEFVRVASK